jgi:cytochrome c oxidase subunit 2
MRRALTLLPFPLLLSGCDGIQSITGGEGRDSALINALFAVFTVVTVIFFAAVMAFLFASYWRRGGERGDGLPETDGAAAAAPARPRALRIAFFAWTGAVIVGLMGLAIASYFTDRSMAHPNAANRPVVSIELIANQWWWDVRYHFQDPSKNFRTANEIHLPAGVPAMIYLKSNDVIHSFWVPNLAGKEDLIPGRVNDMVLVPEKIGQYRAQCAEYCGLQHAHMALDVTVESAGDFRAWMARRSAPAPAPATALAASGYNYFMKRECSTCHAIVGTPAAAGVAPDLTHVAGRKTIAAGTLPMGRAGLYAWVADPQGQKPGTNMPYIGLEASELHAVVAYLETLK